MKTYKNHIINVNNVQYNFIEVKNTDKINTDTLQSYGTAETITDLIRILQIDKFYYPYGYILRSVLHIPNTKTYTAYFFKIGDSFLKN